MPTSKGQRIIEIYTAKPVKRVANPMKSRTKQFWAGHAVVGYIDPKKESIRWSGVGTVKIIPVSQRTLRGIAKASVKGSAVLSHKRRS